MEGLVKGLWFTAVRVTVVLRLDVLEGLERCRVVLVGVRGSGVGVCC